MDEKTTGVLKDAAKTTEAFHDLASDTMKAWAADMGIWNSALLFAGYGALSGLDRDLFGGKQQERESDAIFSEMAEHARLAVGHAEQATHFERCGVMSFKSWVKVIGTSSEHAAILSYLMRQNSEFYSLLSADYAARAEEQKMVADLLRGRHLEKRAEEDARIEREGKRSSKIRQIGCKKDRCSGPRLPWDEKVYGIGDGRCQQIATHFHRSDLPEHPGDPRDPGASVPRGTTTRYCEQCADRKGRDAIDPLAFDAGSSSPAGSPSPAGRPGPPVTTTTAGAMTDADAEKIIAGSPMTGPADAPGWRERVVDKAIDKIAKMVEPPRDPEFWADVDALVAAWNAGVSTSETGEAVKRIVARRP